MSAKVQKFSNATQTRRIPKAVSLGAVFALLAVLFGFGIGGAFGAFESQMRNNLKERGDAVLETVYKGDGAAKDAVVAKSWSYMKRAHLHGGGIGAAALGAIAALVLLTQLGTLAKISSVSFGLGALLYSVFWLWAGFLAPGLGSTDAAKEALSFIAIPGAGLSIFGVVGTIVAVAKDAFAK
jgi:hypothetical protein